MLRDGLRLRNGNLSDSNCVRTTVRNLDPDDTRQFALRLLCASPCFFLPGVSTEASKPCGCAGIGRTELTLRTVSPTGVKVDLPVDPQGRRVIEMELLRGSLARQDFSLMHDSKSCPPASDGYGNPLVNPAPPGGTAGTWVSSDFSTLECAADEVPVMDRQAALYGVSMQPPVNWATVSGAATESSVGNQVVWMYGVAWSITLGGLLPFEKGMSIAFDATAAEGDLASGVHETVLTISYRQSNNLGASGDSESFPGCGGLLAASGEQGKLCADLTALELLLRFKVVQPSYFLLLAPSGLNEQMAAGSSADYTLQLYNAMPGPLDWHIRCADLPTAAGVIRLAVDTSTVPCGGGTPSGTGTLEFQGEGSLTVSVTAPDVVQTDPYNYVLHIPATNENGATIEQTLPITVVVVAEMLADRSLTRLDIPTSVTAGAPMVVEVRAKDQYNNSILTAGLSFSMDVTAANPESPWATARTFLSRFTVDGYIIETDAIPQQGAYSLSVTNSDNQERIGGGSNPSFEIQVEPITCSGTNVAPDESGLVCVCSPGYGRGTNAAGLHVCVPCTDTTAGGSGTLYSSATTAGECIPCLDGTRPNAAQSACDDCPVGEAGVGGRCTACDAGKIPEANRHACEFCPAGKQPNEAQNDCVQCAVGSATNTGVCQACDAGKRPVDGGSRCEVCPAGKEPNEGQIDCVECAAGSATAIGVCQACGPGKMARPRATACETCPLGKAPDYNRTDCEVCPEGKVGNTGSCETCAKGKTPDESQNFCEKCPRFSTTLEAGATTCVCENNYFSRSFDIVNASDGNGAEPSLQCEKCPFGAVCEGISNSIYAKPGYWINVYQSSHGLDGDSSRSINPPQFKPVHCLKETNNCIGYCDQDGTETETPACKPVPNEATPQLEPNACKLGLTGPLCAFCEDGEYGRANLKYRKVEGTCVKCDGIDWPNAFVTYGMYTLMCTFFLFKSRRIITGRDCDIHNSSCIIGISLFFVQTMVLLPSETFGHLDFVKELAGAVSMSPDTTDQTDGKCLSFGDFYYDWLMKFSIPLYNITATVFLVFLAGLWKRSPWQGKMALFFALQSSLFAINLRAISLFFCRTDLSCGDQCPSSWLPHGHLRVDPSQSCTTHRHLAYLAVAALIFATFAFGLPALLCKSIGERMDAHRKLLRIEAYLKYGFEQGAIVLQNKDWSDMHSAEYAARDYLSVIYYPLRRQKYWWAAVWIVRPTVIATVYNARDRGSGVAFGFADWRILVVWLLMLYNCIQATVRPFKHVNESQLDSFSVLLLMSMFTVSINNDFVSAKEASLANTADRVAKFMTVVLVCLVVLATVQSKLRTVGNIKKMIARDRWRSAWSHMSGNECDPLADVGKLVDHLEEDANKKTGVLAKLTQIGIVGVKLPVFEQIDVDESGFISLNEFLEWWRVRTIRTGLADEMRGVAADLFGQFDADNSGEVDRDEFNHFLTGLREWHAKQRALMSQFEESPEARKQRIRIQREKVVENLHKHGWTESPAGWVRPVQLGTPVAGMINPLAASFEVDLPATAGATPASTVIATTAAASHSAKSAQAAGVPTVEEIFSSIDSDRSGSVCFHEFSQWWTSHGGTGSMLELAKRAFGAILKTYGSRFTLTLAY